MSVADGFRRISAEYEKARNDMLVRHFLVQFIATDLRSALRDLAPDKGNYKVHMPNYRRSWPSLPWFAVSPRRVAAANFIHARTIFVVDPSEGSAHIAGALAIPPNQPPSSVELQLASGFRDAPPTNAIRSVVAKATTEDRMERWIYKTRQLDSLEDGQLRADIGAVAASQMQLAQALSFSAADFFETIVAGKPLDVAAAVGRRPKPRASTKKSEKGKDLYPVWYCTSRKPQLPFVGPHWYSNSREEGGKLHFGLCLVDVPESHAFGAQKSRFWKLLLPFGTNNFRIASLESLSEPRFWQRAHEGLQLRESDERDALVYVHGFNTSFADSIMRAGQIAHDLKFPGIATAFSWPSQCSITPRAYAADHATISAHCSHLAEFIVDLIVKAKPRRVHVVAHSMGSLAILRGCIGAKIFTKEQVRRIGQVILAAADVDDQEFVRLAPQTPCARTTLYASHHDSVLKLSSGWNKFKRAGLLPPPTIIHGVDTIDAGPFDLSDIGHGYVADAERVLHDMYELVRHNTPPAKRARMKAAIHRGAKYWRLV